MHRRDIEQKYQDEVKPIIRLYNIHKYINADTVILCTKMSIKMHM